MIISDNMRKIKTSKRSAKPSAITESAAVKINTAHDGSLSRHFAIMTEDTVAVAENAAKDAAEVNVEFNSKLPISIPAAAAFANSTIAIIDTGTEESAIADIAHSARFLFVIAFEATKKRSIT